MTSQWPDEGIRLQESGVEAYVYCRLPSKNYKLKGWSWTWTIMKITADLPTPINKQRCLIRSIDYSRFVASRPDPLFK